MIDLYTSRREHFLECEYWSQDENDYVKISEIAYKISPTGTFLAKEEGAYTNENQVLSEIFMLREKNVVVSTFDDVSDLKRNDIVRINEEMYRVEDIQVTPVNKQRQFMNSGYSKKYYISLRG